MKSLEKIYLRIDPSKFHYLKFILEAYDNLGVLSSHQHSDELVVIRVSSGYYNDLIMLLSHLSRQLRKPPLG